MFYVPVAVIMHV